MQRTRPCVARGMASRLRLKPPVISLNTGSGYVARGMASRLRLKLPYAILTIPQRMGRQGDGFSSEIETSDFTLPNTTLTLVARGMASPLRLKHLSQ